MASVNSIIRILWGGILSLGVLMSAVCAAANPCAQLLLSEEQSRELVEQLDPSTNSPLFMAHVPVGFEPIEVSSEDVQRLAESGAHIPNVDLLLRQISTRSIDPQEKSPAVLAYREEGILFQYDGRKDSPIVIDATAAAAARQLAEVINRALQELVAVAAHRNPLLHIEIIDSASVYFQVQRISHRIIYTGDRARPASPTGRLKIELLDTAGKYVAGTYAPLHTLGLLNRLIRSPKYDAARWGVRLEASRQRQIKQLRSEWLELRDRPLTSGAGLRMIQIAEWLHRLETERFTLLRMPSKEEYQTEGIRVPAGAYLFQAESEGRKRLIVALL